MGFKPYHGGPLPPPGKSLGYPILNRILARRASQAAQSQRISFLQVHVEGSLTFIDKLISFAMAVAWQSENLEKGFESKSLPGVTPGGVSPRKILLNFHPLPPAAAYDKTEIAVALT